MELNEIFALGGSALGGGGAIWAVLSYLGKRQIERHDETHKEIHDTLHEIQRANDSFIKKHEFEKLESEVKQLRDGIYTKLEENKKTIIDEIKDLAKELSREYVRKDSLAEYFEPKVKEIVRVMLGQHEDSVHRR